MCFDRVSGIPRVLIMRVHIQPSWTFPVIEPPVAYAAAGWSRTSRSKSTEVRQGGIAGQIQITGRREGPSEPRWHASPSRDAA